MQMFIIVSSLIKSIERSNLTNIDKKVLKLCETFINEEQLILRYSKDNDIPPQLVRDEKY